MDDSDFKGPPGVSMTPPGSGDAGITRMARRSACYWNFETPGDNAVSDHYAAIVLALRLVEALHIIGETEEASFVLARALRISMSSGIFQTFIDGAAAGTQRILSPRECHILQLIGRGMSNKRIAQELKIAPETVKSHAKHIFVKLKVRTRAEAVARAAGLSLL